MPYSRSKIATFLILLALLLTIQPNVSAKPARSAAARAPAIRHVPANYSTIQAAINAAATGDMVLVAPGLYTENLLIDNKEITLASHFVNSGDPNDIAQTIIDGDGGSVIRITNTVGPATAITGFTIRNGDDGLSVFANIDVTHNRFINNKDAIDYESGGGLCQYNEFFNNRDDAIDLDGAAEVYIADNNIYDNNDDGIEIRFHRYTGPMIHIVITRNTIRNSGEDGIQLIGQVSTLTNRTLTIDHNLIANSAIAGIGMMSNGDTVEDLRAASLPETIYLFNNTFVDNPYLIAGGDKLLALNNIFVNASMTGLIGVDGDSLLAHNLFWNIGTLSVNSNLDLATTLQVDPLLTTDHRLKPASPALDAGISTFDWMGTTVLDIPTIDYFGSAPDLGAYEAWPPAVVPNQAIAQGSGLLLSWDEVTATAGGEPATIDHYAIHRYHHPHFTPSPATLHLTTMDTSVLDDDAAALDEWEFLFYTVVAVDSTGHASPVSGYMGRITQPLAP